MSGIVSSVADNVAIGSISLAANGCVAVASFLTGAFCTTLFIRWGKRKHLHSQYALPLLVEAVLLLIFGITGKAFSGERFLRAVALLCFTMGLQNAMITKLSNAVIRTTHLTGMITDIGISLGRLVLATPDNLVSTSQEFSQLRLLTSLIFAFFIGGVTGANGFTRVGFLFTIPLSMMLLAMAMLPIFDDLKTLDAHV
ncbi:YoaK family protein [Granulicella cerasi]|uniref:YoaK family protein n=2 Tax=Granulicella cerasi TaxID=741063 RepID=A0ABW1ZDD6_9BACT